MTFNDRREAGRKLAEALRHYRGKDAVVLALPRGGVPVAAEVAASLDAPLDLLLVRKVGVPWQPELAMGAVIDGAEPITVRNEDIIGLANVTEGDFDAAAQRELEEIERRRKRYIGERPRPTIKDHVAIIIDDGIATGATVRAAIRGLKRKDPTKVVLAVPVAPPSTVESLREEVDELVCLEAPEMFHAISLYYREFSQVSDEEVTRILDSARATTSD
ncbi:phosphoribosyltransferase [Dichotomicrobium thermohalophilum]|uniref:Putative phosphoribosyltransferase n=1 Tax=Dichotomicrobium thermohalophilum TaxID=933063 RepID=A0A397Q3N3_9HYPH|nr:phosphoribosyltransferase family protein [Dichotomicrobium thermohalophilum]RIA55732.1 putative phosphoribosyltransferase [Dichotomicrobium thermohalophilum]